MFILYLIFLWIFEKWIFCYGKIIIIEKVGYVLDIFIYIVIYVYVRDLVIKVNVCYINILSFILLRI